MLILLPASEAKARIGRGNPLDPTALSFPELAPTREAVLDALIKVSAEPDATHRLGVRAGLSDVVHDNVDLRDAPAAAAGSVYTGPLHAGIGRDDLDAASRRRADEWIVVISALWGAVRLGDHIPPYRLNMCGRLPGLAHLTDVWRDPLSEVLPGAAGRGIVVDGRSSEYLTAWRPRGELAERTVTMKVVRDLEGRRGSGSHNAKYTRGLVVRIIVSEAHEPRRPEELAAALSRHFSVDLRPPQRAAQPWELSVVESAAIPR